MRGYPHDISHDVPETIGPRGGQLEPQSIIPVPIRMKLSRHHVGGTRQPSSRFVPDPAPLGQQATGEILPVCSSQQPASIVYLGFVRVTCMMMSRITPPGSDVVASADGGPETRFMKGS